MQDRRHIGQSENNDERIENIWPRAASSGDQQTAPMIPQHFADRSFDLAIARFELFEHWRFLHAAANPKAENHQRQTRDEWNAPSPAQEVCIAQLGCEYGDHCRREDRTAGWTDLGP